MNDRGRDVLLEASLNALPQLRHSSAIGGLSAVGLLLQAAGCRHLLLPGTWFLVPENVAAHTKCWRRASRRYGVEADEWTSLNWENDALGWDFLTMAWWHKCSGEARATFRGADEPAMIEHTMPPVSVPAASSDATATADVEPIRTYSVSPAGHLKQCVYCGELIYLHLDADGRWRPYDSWKSGRASHGHWQLHHCGAQ